MKKLFVLTVISSLIISSALAAAMKQDTIKLKHVPASTMMKYLGLYTTDDLFDGRNSPWQKTTSPINYDHYVLNADYLAKHKAAFEGMDEVKPGADEKSLIVHGTQDSIDKLKAFVDEIDVERKIVSVKSSFYKVDKASLSAIMQDPQSVDSISNDQIIVLKMSAGALEKLGPATAEPQTSAANNTCVRLRLIITSGNIELSATEYAYLPRVNGDGTITLQTKWKTWDNSDLKHPKYSMTGFNRRLADGAKTAILLPECWRPDGSASRTIAVICATVVPAVEKN